VSEIHIMTLAMGLIESVIRLHEWHSTASSKRQARYDFHHHQLTGTAASPRINPSAAPSSSRLRQGHDVIDDSENLSEKMYVNERH